MAIGTWPATRQPVIDRVPQGKNGPAPISAGQVSIRGPCPEEELPVVDEWVTTADAARSDGFTPRLYESLFDSLKAIKRWAYRSHPKNRMLTAGKCNPAVPFESVLWEDWPRLVRDEGASPQETTELILLLAEPKFPPRR